MSDLLSPPSTLRPTRSHSASVPRQPSRTRTRIHSDPGASAHDLPSCFALNDLDLIRSISRNSQGGENYRGGGGLGKSGSRVSALGSNAVVGMSGKIGGDHVEEEAERDGGVMDEEAGLGKDDEVILETDAHAEAMYERFTERRKGGIVAVVAFAAVLAPFSSSAFLPSIPSIVVDLNTTATILNITVAIFILVIGITPLIWAPFSGVYGRKPIYIISLPIFTLGSLGVALSPNLTGAGSSAVLSVGAGTIGDLYPRERRGKAMGLFYSGVLIGPSVAPAVAGVLTEYVYEGWRAMQWLLFAMGALACLLVVFVLPETSHARGVDLIRAERDEKRALERKERGELEAVVEERTGWWKKITGDFIWVGINPLGPLKLLARPHILAMSINSSFVLMSTYTVLVPLGETLAPRYNITNSAILGCFYLAQGLGNYFAAQWTGRYADWTLRIWLKKRNGVYVAEDRLKATLIGGGFILPVAVLALGWTLEKASGTGGIVAAVILLFINGIGLMIVLTPANTYCIDVKPSLMVMQNRSAEVIAVNNCCRYVISAAASAFVLPMIQAIGVGWTNTFSALIVWLGFGLVLFTIKYGARMRAYGDDGEEGSAGEMRDAKELEEKRRASETTLVRDEKSEGLGDGRPPDDDAHVQEKDDKVL
ncbi:hypothetical protein P7C70_g5122, partial [Phenoliferia sp. Uapishka_3]